MNYFTKNLQKNALLLDIVGVYACGTRPSWPLTNGSVVGSDIRNHTFCNGAYKYLHLHDEGIR